MARSLPFLGLLLILIPLTLAADNDLSSVELEEQDVLGHVEAVRLMPDEIPAKARLDTGASRSSLHAREIEAFDKDGEEWVRFVFDDHDGGKHDFELPIEDEITVTQASGQENRYVVKVGLCVGAHYSETDFTLTDRSALTYPILVGRTFLSEGILVSSEHDRTVEPDCG